MGWAMECSGYGALGVLCMYTCVHVYMCVHVNSSQGIPGWGKLRIHGSMEVGVFSCPRSLPQYSNPSSEPFLFSTPCLIYRSSFVPNNPDS